MWSCWGFLKTELNKQDQVLTFSTLHLFLFPLYRISLNSWMAECHHESLERRFKLLFPLVCKILHPCREENAYIWKPIMIFNFQKIGSNLNHGRAIRQQWTEGFIRNYVPFFPDNPPKYILALNHCCPHWFVAHLNQSKTIRMSVFECCNFVLSVKSLMTSRGHLSVIWLYISG